MIIGLWGALTFGPFIARHIAPWIASNAPDVPVLSYLKGNTGYGEGLLTSGLVLAVMVIPIVAATTRDLIRQVPILPREGAIALGLSDFECARKVTLPWVGAGIVGAVVLGLGLGRALAAGDADGTETFWAGGHNPALPGAGGHNPQNERPYPSTSRHARNRNHYLISDGPFASYFLIGRRRYGEPFHDHGSKSATFAANDPRS